MSISIFDTKASTFDMETLIFGYENIYSIASRIPPGLERKIDDKMEVGMDFGWFLVRLLVDFGTKLGGKLGSSWH